MNAFAIERNTFFIPVMAGQGLPDKLCQLGAGAVAIKGVTVDNQNTGITVLVYAGTSPNGVPYPVAPGKSVSVAIDGPFGAYLRFEGIATANGVIYVAVSAQAAELFNASAVTVENPINIQGTVPVSVQGALPIASPVYPPPGALLVDYNQRLVLTSASVFPIQLSPGPGTGAGLALFTLFVAVRGFDRQPYLNWRFQCKDNVGANNLVYAGWGDERLILPQTYLERDPTQAVQGVYWDVLNPAAIVGTFNCYVAYSGYYA